MFNKKPLIKWLMISAVLALLAGALQSERTYEAMSLKIAVNQAIQKAEGGQSKSQIPLIEAKKAKEKLAEIIKDYPDPKERFTILQKNYEFGSFAVIADNYNGLGTFGWEFDKNRNEEKGYSDFDDDQTIDISISQKGFRKLYLCLFTIISQREYLPIKGQWESVCFLRKISENPDGTQSRNELQFQPKEMIRQSGSSSEGDHNIITKASFRDKLSRLQPGLYALQSHLYPDELMMETMDGFLKSPIYYLRLRK